MIGVVDYGVGNIKSVLNACAYIGQEAMLLTDPRAFDRCDRLILPGVGAFADAMKSLEESGLRSSVERDVKAGKPILGICLGMQLLFERSYEDGCHEGLGLLSGEVVKFDRALGLKIPHIGWNRAAARKKSAFIDGSSDDRYYFVHSYYVVAEEADVLTETEYGVDFTSAVERDNIFAVQFHPEKSGDTGLALLRAFGGIR